MLNKEKADKCLEDMPTNYVGSKRKIIPWMTEMLIKHEVIKEGVSFIDLFGGSGIVSYYFSNLGISGTINELLISSHLNHCAMFDGSNPLIHKDQFQIPYGVKLIKYEYIENGKKEIEESLFDDMDLKENNLISCKAIFESKNEVFNNIYNLMSKYIMLFFTAKEAFEISCGITNFIMYESHGFSSLKSNVVVSNKDVFTFLESIKYGFPEKVFAYIDPPYGGSNSNYHKIYSVIECIAYASMEIKKRFNECLKDTLENIGEDNKQTRDYISTNLIAYKYEGKSDWPDDVDELPHIKEYGWRFNTTNVLNFKLSFEKMMELLISSGITTWIFSFNKDTSWTTEEEFIEYMQTKFNCSVVTERIAYNYSYRTVNAGAKNVDMSQMTVGSQETGNIIGQREETSEEILYICRRN